MPENVKSSPAEAAPVSAADRGFFVSIFQLAMTPYVGYNHDMKNFITVTKAAEILNVDPSQVRRYIREYGLEAIKINSRLYLINPRVLKKFKRP